MEPENIELAKKLVLMPNDAGLEELKKLNSSKFKLKNIVVDHGQCKSCTLLHLAVSIKNLEIVKYLISVDCDPMQPDDVSGGRSSIGKILIQDVDEKSLNILDVLLVSPKLKILKKQRRMSEFTILAMNKNIADTMFEEIFGKLVSRGFDQNVADGMKQTVLIRSIQSKMVNRVKTCLSYSVDFDRQPKNPISFSLSSSYVPEIFKMLMHEYGEVVFGNDEKYDNFLNIANMYNQLDAFEYLITEYKALEVLSDVALLEIAEHREPEYLKLMWDHPTIQKFILDNLISAAIPEKLKDIFIF